MRWSLYIGQFKEIKVYIHWTFILLLGFILFSQYRIGSSTQTMLLTMGFVVCIFSCVLLHEFGHALTALHFNFKTKDIILLPIGGIARMQHLPENAKQELAVAIAGPAVNIVIAGLLFLIAGLPALTVETLYLNTITPQNFLHSLIVINLVLAIFNMIPAFPMDGGRVFRALLALKFDRLTATKAAAFLGQFLAILFIVFGFFNNVWLVFIGFFIFLGAGSEASQEETKNRLSAFHVKDILMKQFRIFHPDALLSKAVSHMLNSQDKEFIIVDSENIVGVLTRNEIIAGIGEYGENVPIRTVMRRDIVIIDSEKSIEEAWTIMLSGNHTILPVVDAGKLSGVIDLENISEFLMIRKALSARNTVNRN
ncbi:MAG: site-2 protease family protein [Leptospiraceae bacterium]|nr:site-2 protease family protein [Leptospiraceae bacterium]